MAYYNTILLSPHHQVSRWSRLTIMNHNTLWTAKPFMRIRRIPAFLTAYSLGRKDGVKNDHILLSNLPQIDTLVSQNIIYTISNANTICDIAIRYHKFVFHISWLHYIQRCTHFKYPFVGYCVTKIYILWCILRHWAIYILLSDLSTCSRCRPACVSWSQSIYSLYFGNLGSGFHLF